MVEYHKIQTVFLRDPDNNFKTLLIGHYALPEFEYLRDNVWVFTEKVDGTNIRVQYGGGIYFRGKTDKAQIPEHLMKELEKMFTEEKLREVFSGVPEGEEPAICLYGEGCGAKIQKGGGNYGLTPNFVLFDVKIGRWWLQRHDVIGIALSLGIKSVPIIGEGTLSEMVEATESGFNSNWGNFIAEGIVARPKVELFARNGKRIITKIKYKDFEGMR